MSTPSWIADDRELLTSIIALAKTLIGISSRGGQDSPEPIVATVSDWLLEHGVQARRLYNVTGDGPVAVLASITNPLARRTICLNACLDTAPFGDLSYWHYPPTDARVVDGWLNGRGAADSKVAVAIFCHLAAYFAGNPATLPGSLLFLFDADEHTGSFGGVKAFMAESPHIDGVAIGYPGNDVLVIGARGFYRVELVVHGTAEHSGLRTSPVANAVTKAAALINAITRATIPEDEPAFGIGPKVTVTAIDGGSSFSVVPDRCSIKVDVRVTPAFNASVAGRWLRDLVASVDEQFSTSPPTAIFETGTWPPYRLSEDSLLVQAMKTAICETFRRDSGVKVGGPSNIGNYLASFGIESTCGFGVTYEGLHAANERVDISTILPVYLTYYRLTEHFLRQHSNARPSTAARI